VNVKESAEHIQTLVSTVLQILKRT